MGVEENEQEEKVKKKTGKERVDHFTSIIELKLVSRRTAVEGETEKRVNSVFCSHIHIHLCVRIGDLPGKVRCLIENVMRIFDSDKRRT